METNTILIIIIIAQGLVIWGRGNYIEELQKMLEYWYEKYGDQEEDEDEEDDDDEDLEEDEKEIYQLTNNK